MTFQPKTFLGPSVLLHVCALGAILLISMNAATLKTPKDKQFRVKMVQSVPRVQTEPPSTRTEVTPPPVKKELVKVTKPEVEKKTEVKKPEPEQKRELVKREPKPKKELVKIPTKSGRTIMKMPDHIRLNQQKWLKDRERKKEEKKTVVKPVEEYTPVKREITVGRDRLKTATTSKTRTFEDVRKNLDRQRENIDKRLKSRLSQFSAAAAHSAQHDEYYVNQIIPAIQSVWITPSAALVPKRALCTIGFRVSRDGLVSNVRVLRESGYNALDNSAVEAVRNARFPAFPSDYRENFFDVEVDFECEPER